MLIAPRSDGGVGRRGPLGAGLWPLLDTPALVGALGVVRRWGPGRAELFRLFGVVGVEVLRISCRCGS